MTGPSLVEFLLARIAEDEAVAERRFNEWRENGGVLDLTLTPGPARVLADCKARRGIVDEHPSTDPINHEGDRYCRRCLEHGYDIGYPDEWVQSYYPCPTLRLLALPYADHPDYNEAWRG